jgi:DNA-directed RNA polymerase subunit A"
VVSEFSINIADSQIELKLNKEKMDELKITQNLILGALKGGIKGYNLKEKDNTIILKSKGKEDSINQVYLDKEKIKKIHLAGVKGIAQVLPVRRGEEYIIITSGTNLKEILALDYVNPSRTTTNDIFEIQKVLGIEAARQAIINEVYKVIESQGLDVDIRHIMLVADTMCNSGEVKGITRYGVVSQKSSVLARASFETPIRHIIAACLIGEEDHLTSVVENVMLNQPVPVGTGLPGLITKVK